MTKTLLLLASCLLATPLSATELPLPASARPALAAIATACPTCAAAGYAPCGGPEVQWGRRFAPHAFRGAPPRAYLPTFTLDGAAFRALARATDYSTLLATLRERFARTRLVVIADGFRSARVLPTPDAVVVRFPEPLHACLRDSDRPWGCCVACERECCEKDLGSPDVALTWHDGDETLTYHYAHTVGVAWLDRRARKTRTRYACLTDARGTLR